ALASTRQLVSRQLLPPVFVSVTVAVMFSPGRYAVPVLGGLSVAELIVRAAWAIDAALSATAQNPQTRSQCMLLPMPVIRSISDLFGAPLVSRPPPDDPKQRRFR